MLHLVGLTLIYLSKMHGHLNIKFNSTVSSSKQLVLFHQFTHACTRWLGQYSDCLQMDSLEFECWQSNSFLVSKTVQTNSVAHTAIYSINTGILSHEYRGQGVKLTTNHHLLTRFKNEWSYTTTPPPIPFMVWTRALPSFVSYWKQMSVELVGVNLGDEQDEDAGLAKMQHYNRSSPVTQGKVSFFIRHKIMNSCSFSVPHIISHIHTQTHGSN